MDDQMLDRLSYCCRQNDPVLAAVGFGSAFRGDTDAQSDLDLLIIHSTDRLAPTLRQDIFASLGSVARHTSVLARNPVDLLDHLECQPHFAAHLLDEGNVIYDSTSWQGVSAVLARVRIDAPSLRREIDESLDDLAPFIDLEPFNGYYITYLANLYEVARSIVIAGLLERGAHEYSWRTIFDRYARLRPDLDQELSSLKGLRQYYEYARARTNTPPSDAGLTQDHARRALESLLRLSTTTSS